MNTVTENAKAEGLYNMSQTAKHLNLEGIGRNNLLEYLRNLNILYPGNIPYPEYMKLGYFVIKYGTANHNSAKVYPAPKVTELGLKWLSECMKEKILEQDEIYLSKMKNKEVAMQELDQKHTKTYPLYLYMSHGYNREKIRQSLDNQFSI